MITTKFASGGVRFHIEFGRSLREVEALGGDNIKPDRSLWTNKNKAGHDKLMTRCHRSLPDGDPEKVVRVGGDSRHHYRKPPKSHFEEGLGK